MQGSTRDKGCDANYQVLHGIRSAQGSGEASLLAIMVSQTALQKNQDMRLPGQVGSRGQSAWWPRCLQGESLLAVTAPGSV